MKKIALSALLVLLGFIGCIYYYGLESCEVQNVYALSPHCLKCKIEAANRGDSAAMHAVSEYYYAQEPGLAKKWYAKALPAGGAEAVLQELSQCKNKPGMPRDQLEDRMAKITERGAGTMGLEASYYYLGGYCGYVDLVKARHFAALRIPDALSVCRVSLQFFDILNTQGGGQENWDLVTTMLAECIERADPGSVSEQLARKALLTMSGE